MGYWKSNVLVLLLMFGVLGYLLTAQIINVEAGYDSQWIASEYGVLGGFVNDILTAATVLLSWCGLLVYMLRWWIIIAILIIWLAVITTRRN